jgi:hypothetical protein
MWLFKRVKCTDTIKIFATGFTEDFSVVGAALRLRSAQALAANNAKDANICFYRIRTILLYKLNKRFTFVFFAFFAAKT